MMVELIMQLPKSINDCGFICVNGLAVRASVVAVTVVVASCAITSF